MSSPMSIAPYLIGQRRHIGAHTQQRGAHALMAIRDELAPCTTAVCACNY
jgi:hypothetical protein